MFGERECPESYYFHHNCLIVPQKDILDVEIEGTGLISIIQRWWHDLFLLPYTCERSRSYFTSSHALRFERFRQFRHYRSRIHPLSKFRQLWDCLILHVFIINKILFRFTSSFLYDKLPMYFFYLGACFELIVFADLYVNLKTGYIDVESKRVILDTKKSVINFCSKKLFLHVASAIPLHWFLFLKYGANVNCGLCKTNKFTCYLKIISVFGLFRVYETSSYWTRNRHQKTKEYFYKFLRIFSVAFVTMIQYYDISEAVCLLEYLYTGHVYIASFLGYRAGLKYGKKDPVTNCYYLCFDIGRMVTSLLNLSFYHDSRVHYLDKMTSLGSCFIAVTFYAWGLLECFALLNCILYARDQRMKFKLHVTNFLECAQMPNELSAKVVQYFDYGATNLKIIETQNELYRLLPDMLKREIKLNNYFKLMMRIPLFSDWPLPIIEEFTVMLNRKEFLINDIVSLSMVQGEGLMIVDAGVLAVYSANHKELGHLINGDYFGQLSLVTDKEVCMSYVVAVTNCTILLLEKTVFRLFMKQHPQLFFKFKMKLRNTNNSKKLEDLKVIHTITDSMQALNRSF